MIVFIVVPKNSGLRKYREIALGVIGAKDNKLLEVRGEDVAFWVEELLKSGKSAIGLTGQDLFREYILKNYRTSLGISRIISWEDPNAMFGKPVLCLLGPKEKTLETIGKKQRICISSKYKTIAKKYLNLLETKGYSFEKFYLNGSSEESFSSGLADLVIDIVYTGSSMEKLGLSVYEKIFSSDFVIIGKKGGK